MPKSGLLIVEDDVDDLNTLLRSVKERGLSDDVRVARDGEEALAALALASLPRLITLDLNLPRVGGFEVLQAAKADRRTSHIPIVIVSSSSAARDIDRAYEFGASSYVVKPQSAADYDQIVGDILRYWLVINAPASSGVFVKMAGSPDKARGTREWPNA